MSNNIVIYLLFSFVVLGLISRRLGQRYTSYVMAGLIVAFMVYAFRKG